MTDPLKAQLSASTRHLLRPLIRVLLRHGFSYGEFAEVVKTVFVEVARDEFTPEGKRASDARVAVVTGLTRKDVKRLRESLLSGERLRTGHANRATRVLSGWYQDPEFADGSGEPRRLDISGPASFASLVSRYSGDMPAGTVLDELKRVGAVVTDDDGRLRMVSRVYMPGSGDPQGLRILGSAGADLLGTLAHNLDPDREGKPRLQRSVFTNRLPPQAASVFKRVAGDQVQHLIENLDNWLSSYEVTESDRRSDLHRTGVGVYLFDDPADSAIDNEQAGPSESRE